MPKYHDEKLGTSSLDPGRPDVSGEFARHRRRATCVIGNIHVCPRVTPNAATPVNFKRNQDLNFWMQVYNLGIDDQTKSNEAKVTTRSSTRQRTRWYLRKAGFQGLWRAQRPVDGGKDAAHGWSATGQVQGDDQNK